MKAGEMRGQQRRWRMGRGVTLVAGALVLALMLAACGIGSVGGSANNANSVTVNVKVQTGNGGATVVLLPVTINGQGPYTMALDTGASISLIDKPLANQLGLPQVGQPGTIAGVASDEKAVPVKVSTWKIGALKLPTTVAAAANLFASQRTSGLKGLVGSDVWRQFGSVTINYSAQTITVPKQVATSLFGPTRSLGASRVTPLAAVWRSWAA